MQTTIEMQSEIAKLRVENSRLQGLINSPETNDFIEAIQLEAAHQIERWGSKHDEGKTAEDWLWIVAYLTTKASQASRYNDEEKYKHHIITCAAACLNWHRNVTGNNIEMQPGAPKPQETH